jgi:cytidylate kinase
MNIKNKNILIIGPPASGKTTLAKKLHEVNGYHKLLHSDDYMRYGYKQALYELIKDLQGLFPYKTIVEGIQGYRLLRKGAELGVYFPDLVIEMQVTAEQQANVYRNERDITKLKYLKGFADSHAKVLDDYFELVGDRRPEWIKINVHQ